jgi:hypothetical protein
MTLGRVDRPYFSGAISSACTRIQSSPSINAPSCAGVSRFEPSSIFGQRNRPSSSAARPLAPLRKLTGFSAIGTRTPLPGPIKSYHSAPGSSPQPSPPTRRLREHHGCKRHRRHFAMPARQSSLPAPFVIQTSVHAEPSHNRCPACPRFRQLRKLRRFFVIAPTTAPFRPR